MTNPSLLFCDSDALIQLIIISQLKLLKELKSKYNIQPVLVSEVENELRQNRKYKALIGPQLNKALSTQTIQTFDEPFLQAHLRPSGLPVDAIRATWNAIQSKGLKYEVRVGLGEAHTHAAAVVLDMPSMSHDAQALHILLRNNEQVPSTVVRVFDILALFNQCRLLSSRECDTARSTLIQNGEWIPSEFDHCDYETGLPHYCVRILDNAIAAIGCAPSGSRPFAKQLFITQI